MGRAFASGLRHTEKGKSQAQEADCGEYDVGGGGAQNPFKVDARKIFGEFNPLVSTFVSQHTILQRIESGRWGELS